MDNKGPWWEVIGDQFVKQYYQVFDTNREQLVALYAVRTVYYIGVVGSHRYKNTGYAGVSWALLYY